MCERDDYPAWNLPVLKIIHCPSSFGHSRVSVLMFWGGGALDTMSVSTHALHPRNVFAGCAETAVELPDGRGRNGGGKPEDKKEEERFYFSFCPHATYRFVGLDPYDLNVLWDGEETGVDGTGSSTDYLSKRNPNADKNNSSGLDGVAQRCVRVECVAPQPRGDGELRVMLWLFFRQRCMHRWIEEGKLERENTWMLITEALLQVLLLVVWTWVVRCPRRLS